MKLARTVHGLRDPNGNTVSLNAGDDAPDWAVEQITNPAAFEEEVAQAAEAGYPTDGTVEDIKAWVGDDPDRARIALDAEDTRDKPRSTLVDSLRAVAGE